jgi:hypothetical protein
MRNSHSSAHLIPQPDLAFPTSQNSRQCECAHLAKLFRGRDNCQRVHCPRREQSRRRKCGHVDTTGALKERSRPCELSLISGLRVKASLCKHFVRHCPDCIHAKLITRAGDPSVGTCWLRTQSSLYEDSAKVGLNADVAGENELPMQGQSSIPYAGKDRRIDCIAARLPLDKKFRYSSGCNLWSF